MSDTTTIVIFGASGDLTQRKLVPALFDLHCKGSLPDNLRIVGVSRSKLSNEEFRSRMAEGVEKYARFENDEMCEWENFSNAITYEPGDVTHPDDMRRLDRVLSEGEGDGQANRLYYLSIAPKLYEPVLTNLGAANMAHEGNGWRRIVIEKPFGHDLASAQTLNAAAHDVFSESQIYRIDHFLGKETVQNIMVFRFANSLYEPVWNRNYIDHVQITAAETVDVGRRADYYDEVGVVRDMMQNHMLQLLALVAAEPPASFDADAMRNEKVKVLSAIRPIKPQDTASETVRGQYLGYRETEGVSKDSKTATYAAIRFFVDNWRWQDVPFYLRSGKAMAAKSTAITIYFKEPPHMMFPVPPGEHIAKNSLTICIQPDEGIHLAFQAKEPDTVARMETVEMEFHYAEAFGPMAIPEAYERLLLDVLKGDASLFTRGDSIELAWSLIDPILAGWDQGYGPSLSFYDKGSWGPVEAEFFIAEDCDAWSAGCEEHQ